MGYEQFLVGREAKDISLEMSDGTALKLKIRGIPWSRRNQILSLSLKWDNNGQASFDSDGYMRECLKYMIVEAPWGQTTDVFLTQANDELGAALESLVPKAFTGGFKAQRVDDVKKEPSNTSAGSTL